MITINATGDTTLHTAGKYCPEDILVKVPAGGSSGGASVETCTVTINPVADMILSPEPPNYNNVTYVTYYNNVAETQTTLGQGSFNTSQTFENVICGSFICFASRMTSSVVVDDGELMDGLTGSRLIYFVRVDGDTTITLR